MEGFYKNSKEGGEANKRCKTAMSRIYFSKFMQGIYILLVFLCIVSIILNFLLQVDFSGNYYSVHIVLTIIEIVICVIIATEISLRIYLQRIGTCCSLANITDVIITIFCVVGIVLSFQSELLKAFGNGATEALLVVRNVIFLARLYLVFKRQNEINIRNVSIQQNIIETKKCNASNEMKIFNKYKPIMETLLEEGDEEDGIITNQGAWKGKRISSD